MKTTITLAALVGFVAAQEGYGAPPPGYGGVTTTTTTSTSSIVTPPTYPSSSSTTFACNPAHQYPAGQTCTTISGSLTLVTSTATPPPGYGGSTTSSSTTTSSASPPPYYGGSTTSTSVYPTSTCPAPGVTENGCYSCNPAHEYPAGQTCVDVEGCPCLQYSSSTVTPPTYPSTTSCTTSASATPTCPAPGMTENGCYSCNPAHEYPAGQTCVDVEGCPCLQYSTSTPPSYPSKTSTSVYPTSTCPAPGMTENGCYSCNPAHEYPAGQTCVDVAGCPCLQYHKPSSAASYSVPTWAPSVYTTKTVSVYTTYCPTPTTLTHEHTTYTVTKPETVTLPCSTGCVVTSPVAPPAYTPPAYTSSSVYVPPMPVTTEAPPPPAYTTTPAPYPVQSSPVAPVSSAPSAYIPTTTSYSPPAYTGAAGQIKSAGSLVAAVAMGAFFL